MNRHFQNAFSADLRRRPWDQEIVLDQLVRRNRIDVSNDNTPARTHAASSTWATSGSWSASTTSRTVTIPISELPGPVQFFRLRVDPP